MQRIASAEQEKTNASSNQGAQEAEPSFEVLLERAFRVANLTTQRKFALAEITPQELVDAYLAKLK
ncbi:hypothetical protein KA017_03625 [Candidatus Woesebacteria bacterium]|nr:hypothetical protein [Candidatus Woesebacteria bacterium]